MKSLFIGGKQIGQTSSNASGEIYNFPYTGSVQEITLGKGTYKLEVWGAQGGSYSSYYGGAGGYSYGTLTLTDKATLYVYAGGQPTSSTTIGAVTGGFNGGGDGCVRAYSGTTTYGQGGGGGSDIRIGIDSLYSRVIVAGGGGGSASVDALTTKCGGGETGAAALGSYYGTQTAAGTNGSFGQGGAATTNGTNYKYGSGGGGGGWYGGGAYTSYSDSASSYRSYNGGGSGFVWKGSNAPIGYLLGSNYYLTDAATIKGNTSFKSPTGTNETGHTGNGYCRITCIKGEGIFKPEFVDYIESTGSQYIDTEFIPNSNTRVVLDAEVPDSSSAVYVMGVNDWTSGKYFQIRCSTSGTTYISDYGTQSGKNTSVTATGRLIFDKNKNVCTIGSTSVTNTASEFSCTTNLKLLAGVTTSGKHSATIGKIYSCQIYDNDVLIRDYIPALQNGIFGLWDKVENKFYKSASTTNFLGKTLKPRDYFYLNSQAIQKIYLGINKIYPISSLKVNILSNQGDDDPDIIGVNATVNYGDTSIQITNGQTISLPIETLVTITFPEVENYDTPEPIEFYHSRGLSEYSVTYMTELVTINVSTNDSQDLEGTEVYICQTQVQDYIRQSNYELFIEDSDGYLWDANTWNDSFIPNGIAVFDPWHEAVIYYESLGSFPFYSSDIFPSDLIVEENDTYKGKEYTQLLINTYGIQEGYVLGQLKSKQFPNNKDNWYIPAEGELGDLSDYKDELKILLKLLGKSFYKSGYKWTSQRISETGFRTWAYNGTSGSSGGSNAPTSSNLIIPFCEVNKKQKLVPGNIIKTLYVNNGQVSYKRKYGTTHYITSESLEGYSNPSICIKSGIPQRSINLIYETSIITVNVPNTVNGFNITIDVLYLDKVFGECVKVPYISNPESQYSENRLSIEPTDCIEIDLQLSTIINQGILGHWWGSSRTNYFSSVIRTNSSGYWQVAFGNSLHTTNKKATTERCTLKLDSTGFYVNGVFVMTPSNTTSEDYSYTYGDFLRTDNWDTEDINSTNVKIFSFKTGSGYWIPGININTQIPMLYAKPDYLGNQEYIASLVNLTKFTAGNYEYDRRYTQTISTQTYKVPKGSACIINSSQVPLHITPLTQMFIASKDTHTVNLDYQYTEFTMTTIRIDQTTTNSQLMIKTIADTGGIAAIRSNSHRYIGTYSNGNMSLKQLNDNNGTKYVDGTSAPITTLGNDVFMKLPMFSYKCKQYKSNIWDITFVYNDIPDDSYKIWEGNDLIGAYEGYVSGSKLYSVSGKTPTQMINQPTLKTYARNRGTGYSLIKWKHHCMMAVLFWAYYNHTSFKTFCGIDSTENTDTTGILNSLGMNDTDNTATNGVNFWGLERWVGSNCEFIDNATISDINNRVLSITEDDGTVRTLGTASKYGNTEVYLFGENMDLMNIDGNNAASGTEYGFCSEWNYWWDVDDIVGTGILMRGTSYNAYDIQYSLDSIEERYQTDIYDREVGRLCYTGPYTIV